MRWGESDTYKFVKIYLSHNFLWNPENSSYRVKGKRLKAYKEISAEFKAATGIALTIYEIKIKIKNLRSTYLQELAKIRLRSNSEWTYQPNMKWFSLWHKCFGVLAKKRTEDPPFDNHQDPTDDTSDKTWESQNDDNLDETLDPFPETDEDYNVILKAEPRELSLITEDSYQNKKKKTKHQRPSTDCSDGTYRESIDSNMDSTMKEDEFDIYGKYIASQLRRMDLQKALRVQLEIQTLVSEARISGLNGKH